MEKGTVPSGSVLDEMEKGIPVFKLDRNGTRHIEMCKSGI